MLNRTCVDFLNWVKNNCVHGQIKEWPENGEEPHKRKVFNLFPGNKNQKKLYFLLSELKSYFIFVAH